MLILRQVLTSQPPCLSTQVSLDSSHCNGLLSYCLQLPDAHPAAGCGRMTDGFVRGLEQRASSSTEASVYEDLQALLLSSCDDGKEIFLTGHSIGGAGIVTFAQLLAVRQVGSSPWRIHLRLRSQTGGSSREMPMQKPRPGTENHRHIHIWGATSWGRAVLQPAAATLYGATIQIRELFRHGLQAPPRLPRLPICASLRRALHYFIHHPWAGAQAGSSCLHCCDEEMHNLAAALGIMGLPCAIHCCVTGS